MPLRLQSSDAVSFGIDDPFVPIQVWSGSATNRFQLDGTLTIGGQPVAGVVLKANSYTLPQPTGADGSFSVRRDQTVVDRTLLTVSDTSAATIGGKAITSDQAAALADAQAAIETGFVITLAGDATLKAGAKNVEITGTALFADGKTPVPPVALWGYTLSGVISDPDGKPLSGVYASVSDDEGETWAVSNQTGDDGAYQLRFFPQGDATTFSVRVAYGGNVASSMDEVDFAPEVSTQLDLVLYADEQMVMGTGPNGAFEQTTIDGAEYVGYLIGLAVDGAPVAGNITWPDTSGVFTVTIPTVDFTGTASFFQQRVRFFSDQENVPGADVEASVIPGKLDARTPRLVPPAIAVS